MKPSIAPISRRLPNLSIQRCTTPTIASRQFHSTSRAVADEPASAKSTSVAQSKESRPTRGSKSGKKTERESNQRAPQPLASNAGPARQAISSTPSEGQNHVRPTAIATKNGEVVDGQIDTLQDIKHETSSKEEKVQSRSSDPKTEKYNALLKKIRVPGQTRETREVLHKQLEDLEPSAKGDISKTTLPRAGPPLTPKSLITNHIATASSSPHAHRATILAAQAHLARRQSTSFGFDSLLAKALRYGKVVRFANEDEKLRAVALAQEQADNAALRMSVQKKKPIQASKVEFQAAPKNYRQELVGRVVKGDYEEKPKESGAIAQIGKRLTFNGTFTRKPGAEFIEILKRLWPQSSSGKS